LMLASMLERQCWESRIPRKYGAKITETSLQPHLNKLRSDMLRFIDENPQVVKRLSGNG
jgi:hypothetical protein